MKFHQNKVLILFLILTVIFYSFSSQVAEAGDVVDAISDAVNSVFDAVIDVAEVIGNVTLNFTTSVIYLYLGTSVGTAITSLITTGDFSLMEDLVEDGICRLTNLTDNPEGNFVCDSSGGGAVLVTSQNLGCIQAVTPTFYNVFMNTNYYYPTSTQFDESGRPLTVKSDRCQRQPNFNETNRRIAVYRFILPSNSDNNTLYNWYQGIKNQVGNGWLNLEGGYSFFAPNGYFIARGAEVSRIELDYSEMCDGGTCNKFKDLAIPENSYIVYVAKILGPYNGIQVNNDMIALPVCIPGDNKFFSTDNNWPPNFSGNPANAISGPYRTGACPSPTVDLKINNNDSPLNLYLPNNGVVLSWEAQNVSSCTASGDWSGDRPASGSENLGNLLRGTANPGSGRTYQFSITCNSASGNVTDSVSATVFEYPDCSFSANPLSIIPPNSSQLSQVCSYADSCSIDQRVGTVCSGETDCATDSSNVRPTATTTFTLTCQGLDGQRQWQTTVGIGQSGGTKYEEIIPQ